MSDDLDDLERRARAVIDRNRGLVAGAAGLECPVTCGEVLWLIERCRRKERTMDDLDELERRCKGKAGGAHQRSDLTCGEVLSLIERCRRAEERSLYFQRQVDALQLQLDCLNAAMKEGAEAEKELASAPDEPYTEKEIDEMVKKATAPKAGKEEK